MKNSSDLIFSILKKIKIYSLNIIIWMFSLSCIFPVIWLMYSSLKTSSEFNRDIISFPAVMQFSNYSRAFLSADLGRLSMNSAFNAIISMSLAVLIAFTIAYLLARFPFKGNRIIYFLFLFGMLVPMHALLVPIFVQFKAMGLFNKRITLILPYVVFNLPFSLFLLESYIRGIPKDLDEAAFMEGCGTVRTMFSIIFPITKPVIVAVGLLAFISSWNEYPFALILINSQKLKTIPLGLVSFKGEYSTDYPLQMAGIVISTIPVIAIYLAFNKQIIQGMTEGSIKG
jgi:raffinose/stachyose/melibiose transport system permease protein